VPYRVVRIRNRSQLLYQPHHVIQDYG
jgi:hypothetical protein